MSQEDTTRRVLRTPVLVLALGLAGCGGGAGQGAVAGGSGHPAMQPQKVDGIETFKGSNTVGNFVFRVGPFIDKDETSPENLAEELSFPQGDPPGEWWGRSYHPCNLGEAIASIEYKHKEPRLRVRVTVTGEGSPFGSRPVVNSSFEVSDDEKGWNTASFEGKDLNDELRQLPKGSYELHFIRQLDYQIEVREEGTDRTRWEGRWMALAKEKLPVTVK